MTIPRFRLPKIPLPKGSFPKWLPHYRAVDDDLLATKVITENGTEDESLVEALEHPPIREFRDEANKPWYKYFDEFEYRETEEESKNHKWWYWFEPGTSAEEKRLLWKIDFLVAFYSFVGYWVKYLDSSNLNNAYVSGMKEAIGMKGNDLINTQTIFLVGNVVFELPWLFLMPRMNITYVVFVCELGWALFTFVLYRIENVAALQALRFFVGSFEAVFFPSVHFLLASWYKPSEIGRRGGLFYMGQFLGVLTSGLLQSAAYTNLNGTNGLEGWRWMFIIDGCTSFGVAFLGLFCIPGTPSKCYSLWLTDDEIRLARKRMAENHTDVSPNVKSFFNKKTWKRAFTSWHFWVLGFAQFCGFNTNNTSSGSFSLWLKSLKRYDTGKLNNLTTIPPALGLIWIVIVCGGADITRKRFGMIFFSYIINFIANVILAKWYVPEPAKWAAFYLSYWSWSQSSVFNPLISDMLREDSNYRSILWMIIYLVGLQAQAWVSRIIWPTVDSPRYLTGFTASAVFSMAFNFALIVAYVFYKRDEKRGARSYGILVYNSNKSIPPEALEHHGVTSEKADSEVNSETELIKATSAQKDGFIVEDKAVHEN